MFEASENLEVITQRLVSTTENLKLKPLGLRSLVVKSLHKCLTASLGKKAGGKITSAVTLLALLGIGDATGVPVLEGTTSASAEPGKEDLRAIIYPFFPKRFMLHFTGDVS
ncbi:MAG: hypothetical protein R3A13_03015 [Bdellovibrionota bacterium]